MALSFCFLEWNTIQNYSFQMFQLLISTLCFDNATRTIINQYTISLFYKAVIFLKNFFSHSHKYLKVAIRCSKGKSKSQSWKFFMMPVESGWLQVIYAT
jgi:hypothetical protein